MATSSKQTALFGINDWKTIYQTFRQADFRSYDYETLRKSFIDYLRTYYPETYNDYVESSEFIALLDVMAFMGQGLAFRNDLNARENFLDTAERRDSVIKLANLVSYTPKRNLCAEGYLKVTSISTTQNITDLNGQNLSNLPILWNDPANPNWLEQFNTIVNAALINTQKIGRPGNVSEILGIATSEYALAIPRNTLAIAPFTSVVDNISMNFELVSATSVDQTYVYEVPPNPSGRFNMLYRNDKLGFGSPNTGFFFYFKQGTLQSYDFILQEQIANQTVDIDISGVNNTDTWLFQVNTNNQTRTEWKKVESVYADAYLQNETSERSIFSVTSRFNDQVTYVFGDGVFSKIPVGTFRAYVRAGNALTYTIDPSEMQGLTVSFAYISRLGRQETLTVGLQLTEPVSNAQARESIPDIKQRAPTRYYTQNRMVNGEDYNNFPYTLDSSIIKSKAINRSSIGVSKNLDLLDPTGKYSSILNLGNDGALWRDKQENAIAWSFDNTSDIMYFLTQSISNNLGTTEAYQYYTTYYPRYNTSTTEKIYWKIAVVDANVINGYVTHYPNLTKNALNTGIYSTTALKYLTQGAMLKITAPDGKYFDTEYRLVTGVPGPGDITYYWTTVLEVIGDGSNAGEGLFPNGTGPIKLNGYVPTGAIIAQIIPSFSNDLPTNIILEAKQRLELNESFTLVFNNKLKIDEDRWSIRPVTESNYFVKFAAQNVPRSYIVTIKSLKYYFGSVNDVRFSFPLNELVYDPFSGTVLQDNINILGINTIYNTNTPLAKNYDINIVGQTIESDGYINDYEVKVSTTSDNNGVLITNPDYFNEVTGYTLTVDSSTGFYVDSNNIGKYVFFEEIQDSYNLTRQQIVPSADIIYSYATGDEIEVVKYEYSLGQLFYAYGENKFYKTYQNPNVSTPSYNLVEATGYSIMYGRQGMTFKYTHNSNNTVRIDPATTNIIDIYLVTQSYYTAYQNYIQDTTGTVPQPARPTMTELSSQYDKLQYYKMLSDSMILNSVIFKPLFGPKAAKALQGTIKVIKTTTTTASDSEIRSAVLTAMNSYFNIQNWNFGDTFYFSELAAYLHNECGDFVSSAVLVPNDPNETFGDLYEIKCQPYEIFVNAATANNVVVISALTPDQLKAV